MLDKFTEKALKAVIASQQEAKNFSHKQVRTEHLLLGLMIESSGIPSRVLKAVGLSAEEVKQYIKTKIQPASENISDDSISFSPAAIKALELASDKARGLGYIYVGAEHIFIGILAHEKFGSVQLLKELNIDLSRIKNTVNRITAKRSINRAHPEIQSSKSLTNIKKAISSSYSEIPFTVEDNSTRELLDVAVQRVKDNNTYVLGAENLLLAMAQIDSSFVKGILANEGLYDHQVNDYINQGYDRAPEFRSVDFQLTPACLEILEMAHEISITLGYGTVKPEHILLSVLKQKSSVAIEIFKAFNVNPQMLYKKIIEPIEQSKPPTMSIIKLAKEEAGRLEYNVVGTEHILLGLLCVGIGGAARVLNDLGVTLADARTAVEKYVGYGSASYTSEMSFTPRAKKLLEMAWEEAKESGGKKIESEHLLISIVKLNDCMAMKVLTSLGVDAIEITQGIRTISKDSEDQE